MKVRVLSLTEALFERSTGQDADVFAANLIDEPHGGRLPSALDDTGRASTCTRRWLSTT
jgi:hypothetical protein